MKIQDLEGVSMKEERVISIVLETKVPRSARRTEFHPIEMDSKLLFV